MMAGLASHAKKVTIVQLNSPLEPSTGEMTAFKYTLRDMHIKRPLLEPALRAAKRSSLCSTPVGATVKASWFIGRTSNGEAQPSSALRTLDIAAPKEGEVTLLVKVSRKRLSSSQKGRAALATLEEPDSKACDSRSESSSEPNWKP
jgi:hypothetical protein